MDYTTFKRVITKKFLSLTTNQLEKFKACESLYREWNGKINVISRKDTDGLFAHHFLHSLCIAGYAQNRLSGKEILDVGTGGGFPGIPLAILYPESRFTLCDSIGKKVKVAQAVADGLQLGNVTCVNARAEALPETYDFVVSRAVTDLATFYPWVRGKFRYAVFYLKGGDLSEEIDTCVRRCRLDPATLFQAPVSTWFEDPWFAEKKILMISQ